MSDDTTDAEARAWSAYPTDWEADVVLRDGTTTHVRPITPADASALQSFHVNQSERSTYLRFFAALERLSERDLKRFTTVDHHDRVALIAVRTSREDGGEPEHIIGVARFDRIGPDEAEVAFNVADTEQGKGLGSVMLEHIAAVARERGVRRFTAEVLAQNGRMLAVFREAGYLVRQHVEDGVVMVTVDLDPTERSRSVMAERERRSEARSMAALLEPASVLVVVEPEGATEDDALTAPPGQAGDPDEAGGPGQRQNQVSPRAQLVRRVVTNLARSTVDGAPVAVGLVGSVPDVPEHVRRFASVREMPGPVDLVVVAADGPRLATLVRSLARLTPHGVVILPGGGHSDDAGALRALLRVAHTAGMRVVGPGSYGLVRRREGMDLDASLGTARTLPGSVGVFCQSAETAVTLLGTVERRRIGLSSFLSAGLRADVSGNDLMQFWHEDPGTRVVCLFVESIGNPRKFSRIARRLSMMKPVVVSVGGTGHDTSSSSTGQRTPRRTLREMFRQSGVIPAENTHQLIDIAQLLDSQPLAQGRAVGIVASSHALATAVAESARAAGLEPVRTAVVPEDASGERAHAVLAEVFDDPACQAVVAANVPLLDEVPPAFLTALATEAARTGCTTVASILGRHGLVDALAVTGADGRRCQVPAYATAEDAVLALARTVDYAEWRAADHGTYVAPPGIDADAARALVEGWLPADGASRELTRAQVTQLLGCYGVPVVPSVTVRTADEAVAAAQELGWPVVLKSTAEVVRHRADLGGVRLDISDPEELRVDFEAMAARMCAQFGAPGTFEVQPMVPEGVACIVRSEEDALFGPVVSYGLAGDAVDLLDDVSYAMPPLTDVDLATMIDQVRASPRLFGYRGLPPMRTDALLDILARVSRLADDLPELEVLDLQPVLVSTVGANVLGVTARISHSTRLDDTRRSLPR
ncbi:MAG: GNAT family N-acetyltransferase [Cellulomonadaceae bacterium]